MAYTEIIPRNKNKYFYRVISIRDGNKVDKEAKADKLFLNKRIRRNIELIKPKIISVLKRHKIKRASLFGSYTRGDQRRDSDIDIIIEPKKRMGLEFVGVALDLEHALNKKVDLLTYNGINSHIRKYIMKDEVRIL